MYNYFKKKTSILFMVSLLALIVLFGIVGSTLAYFQIEKTITGSYKIGNVTASWYNYTSALTDDNVYMLSNVNLKRGDANGASIQKTDGTAGGDLRIRAMDGSADQYVRVKPKASVSNNYFDISKVVSSTDGSVVNNDNLTLSVTRTAGSIGVTGANPKTLQDYCPSLIAGKEYVLFADTTGDIAKINLGGTSAGDWAFGTARTISASDLQATVSWYGFESVYTPAIISNIMIEKVEGDSEVTQYLTFNYIYNSVTNVVGSETFWPKDSAGWYYNIGGAIGDGGHTVFCNNIVLSEEYPAEFTNKHLFITFEFESLQSANNPVSSIWGDGAAEILGV